MSYDMTGVFHILEKHTPKIGKLGIDPTEIRKATVKPYLGFKGGRGWEYPPFVIEAMRAEYNRTGSLERAAAVFGLGPDAIGKLFRRRKIPTHKKKRPYLEHGGKRYYRRREDGYYAWKNKAGESALLHRVIWQERHGPIPNGMYLIFQSGNKDDFSDVNLKIATKREMFAHISAARRRKRQAKSQVAA